MNLYLVSQNIITGYDKYDSMIVSAESVADARNIHPFSDFEARSWVNYEDIDKLKVNLIGVSNVSKGVVLASYNKG